MEYDKLLYRILLGYYFIDVNNIRYKVVYPDLRLKYEAELLYDKIIEDNKFEKTYLDNQQIKFYLLTNNIWSAQDDEKLKNCEKFLEESKIQLYLNFFNQKNKMLYKKHILKSQQDIIKFYAQKNSFNYLTIEEQALSIKNEFLIINTIYDINNNLVFNNIDDNLEYHQLQIFIKEIIDNAITATQLRSIARSDLWRSYSVANNLEKDIISMNDDFRHLLNLHKMYENAKQHPESPDQTIIDDDDALDGWFLFQNRKTEKEKKKNAMLDKLGGNKIKNANEVFVLTNDIQERNEIYELNDTNSRAQIKELIATSNSTEESIKWQNIGFVQRDLRAEAQQRFVQHQKGK